MNQTVQYDMQYSISAPSYSSWKHTTPTEQCASLRTTRTEEHLSYEATAAGHQTKSAQADQRHGGCANLHTTNRHHANNDRQTPSNGFTSMRDAAKRDFFTIRADAVQDGALASVDTLAEYLVWDGMDRRLRAIASSNHTDKPEAVVTLKQIANDIKIRVGHDLCERTIERAIKKLQDASLIHVIPRFKNGRRQASSFILLFSKTMSENMNRSRRVNKSSIPDTSGMEIPVDTSDTKKQLDSDGLPPKTFDTRTGNGLSSITGSLRYLQSFLGQIPPEHLHTSNGYRDCPESPTDSSDASPDRHQSLVQNCTTEPSTTPVQNCTTIFPPRPESGEIVESGSDGPGQSTLGQRGSPDTNHPTSMSPLFNKAVKENKKDFKNVFSISDFIKREPAKESQTALKTTPSDSEAGYYLDTVHRSGWVSSPKNHLQEYFGSLSTYLFFNKYRTIEAMAEWFQQHENRIGHGEITLNDVLTAAGIFPAETQSSEQKASMRN
ncbi:hypothetical protein AAE485_14510 (plasmid) [Acidithiobacillus ferriphilus]|uniref:hypothetical protein n=1 Tax=Acidithiobacillus ferriphilus TaxID=1689834 RepID=UPI00390CB019